MTFHGRTRELGAVRSALDRHEPALIRIFGLRGSGKTALARRSVDGLPTVYVRCPPLPDPGQRRALAERLDRAPSPSPSGDPVPPASWEELLADLAHRARGRDRPTVLVVDDAHRLTQARSHLAAPLAAALAPGRAGPPLHVVLVGPSVASLPATAPDPALPAPVDVPVGPLPFRSARPLLPGSSAEERIAAYAAFGGIPAVLVRVEAGASLTHAFGRTVLAPGAPLADAGVDLLEREVQTPARYAAILSALASGEAEWSAVHRSVADLTSSGQLAPYVKRLEEMGALRVRRSLDAKPASRSRRYQLADPFLAFWFHFVLPHRDRLAGGSEAELLAEAIRPAMAGHIASVFPEVCRQFVEHDASEALGATARESGSLWGEGYDVPVAGVLRSGVPFYGRPLWIERPERRHLDELDREVRATRYGFGRERRLRLLFTRHPVPRDLARAVARREDAVVVEMGALDGG